MKKMSFIFVFVMLFVCIFAANFTMLAETPEENAVADVIIGTSGISFVPKVSYTQLVLTVSRPDGTVFSRTFESSMNPYLDLSGIYGDNANDGIYTYELFVTQASGLKNRRSVEQAGLETLEVNKMPLSQSGHFRVKSGALVLTNASQEGLSSTMDVLHSDDVIIVGSLCVGQDCVNGETFGFDTFILKENNLRILFNDTSNSGSFPTRNWRLTANDSVNGGADYFSIDDADSSRSIFKVEGGAPANSLYVEDYGRVGLGTSTPVVELHIKDSDTPAVRLEQDSSGGWTPQTWDLAGNESNFFVRDVTNGSKLPFRIQPGTPSSTLCLKSDGKVGIGTWSPEYVMELETTGVNAEFATQRTDGATCYISGGNSRGFFGTKSNHPLRLTVNDAYQLELTSDCHINMRDGGGYDGTWNPASSRELKENIEDLTSDEAIQALEGLTPVKYNYKKDKAEARVGFIAEDVPDLVAMNGRKSLGTVDILAVVTQVLKQQQTIVKEQQKTIEELKKEINELKKKQ